MPRLSLATLERLPPGVARPPFDPARLSPGIVHLGIGGFHRAHMAVYTQDALGENDDLSWGIVGVSLRLPGVRDRLMPQDGLYTVVERAEGEKLGVIGTVRQVLFAPEAPALVLRRIADPQTRIVSLTVTEKGYCHDPATGGLRTDDADVQHDLRSAQAPRTALGFLVHALDRRRKHKAGAVTVLSCDNLPANGRTLAGLVDAFAARIDEGLRAWIRAEVTFPSCMVDRIVPATTEADREAVSRALGLDDAAPVVTEPFRQWVLEDAFAAGRPAWERAGASFVADVQPYEEMKLRLLNGPHSALAYLGHLAGYTFIWEVVADPAFRRFAEGLMAEDASPTLRVGKDVNLAAYRRSVVDRFANPALGHRCRQVAMDGSQKLPQRLLGTLRNRLESGAGFPHVALAIAGWLRYLRARDEAGNPYEVEDPLSVRLVRAANAPGAVVERVRSVLAVREVFGDDLPRSETFVTALASALSDLEERGVRAAIHDRYGREG